VAKLTELAAQVFIWDFGCPDFGSISPCLPLSSPFCYSSFFASSDRNIDTKVAPAT
jgi:hypothetical protein